MTIPLEVKKQHRIVPVRFERAVTGAPSASAPDIDDRGFAIGARQAGWGKSDARGEMVGITQGDTVRVKVARKSIDHAVPLFVTSTDPTIARVASPAGGGPLPADGVFEIQGIKDDKNKPVKLQARYGAADGPVIGELEPHIFTLHKLRVRAHLVTINGVATVRTAASLIALFKTSNDIWRPCGIQFVYDQTQTLNESVPGLAVAGQMTTNMGATPPTWNEFSTIINLHADSNRINVYFVALANEVVGLTFDNSVARTNGYGIVMSDAATGFDLAHELGHYLDNSDHADHDAAGNVVHSDMAVIRRLMYSVYPPATPSHRHDVGYGPGQYGALITVKNLPNELWDGETARARKRSRSPY